MHLEIMTYLVQCYLKKVALGKGDMSHWITLECCSMRMNHCSFCNCVFLEQSGISEGYIEAVERSLMDGRNDDKRLPPPSLHLCSPVASLASVNQPKVLSHGGYHCQHSCDKNY